MESCGICRQQNPLIMLICSHRICLKCAESMKQLEKSQLQNKYWVQCKFCLKKTFSYDFRNLLIDSQELELLTDRSSQGQLNESQLVTNNIQLPLYRRRSMNAVAMDFMEFNNLQNVTPVKKIFSENRGHESQKKSYGTDISKKLQLKETPLKSRQLSKEPKKKNTHKRCNTGIPIKNKTQTALQNILDQKTRTTNSSTKKQNNSSLYNYLLSLTYNGKQQRLSDKRNTENTIQNPSHQKTKLIDKFRCTSQIAIKSSVKPRTTHHPLY